MVKKKSAAYFNKLFTQITFTTTLILLTLTTILYVNFKSYSLELLNIANVKLMNQIFANALQLSDTAKSYTSAFYNHPAAVELMASDHLTAVNVSDDLHVLDQLITAAPLLYSAYLYNGKTNTIYMIGPNAISRPAQSFYDQEIVQMIHQHRNMDILTPIPRVVPDSELSPRPVNVFSYIMKNTFATDSEIQEALIVNVKVDPIFNTISTYHQADSLAGNNILILNPRGQVVAASTRSQFLTDLSQLPYVQKALHSSQPTGYFPADVDGESSVVTYSANPASEWKMLSITPYKYIAGPINKVKNLTLLIGVVMVIVCLAAAYLLARNLYRPIGRLRSTIGELAGDSAPLDQTDEFESISQSFKSTHHHLRALDLFKKSNLQVVKQNLLNNIVKQTVPGDCENLFREYQISLDPHGSLSLTLFRIDCYRTDFSSKYTDMDRDLIKYAMMNIGEEIAGQGACVDMGEDCLVLLLNVKEAPNEFPNEEHRALLQEIQRCFLTYCSVRVSAFVSSTASSIREVNMLYEEALMVSRYRVRYGHGCIVYARAFLNSAQQAYQVDPSLFAKLSGSIHKGQYNDMVDLCSECIRSLQTASYNEIMYTLSTMTTAIFQALNTIETNSTVSFELDFVAFDQKIKALETLEQIHAEYRRLFRLISDRIHQNKDEHKAIIVHNVQNYIHQRYMDKSISTAMVADHMHMATAYLGKLFREQFAKSIAEYLAEVRLKKACGLLRDTSYTLDEIMDRIGWENKKYFFTMFKKSFGATPTEYRLKAHIVSETTPTPQQDPTL